MLRELSELTEPIDRCVRVTGFVKSVDIQNKTCELYHKDACVIVDVSLVDITLFRTDSLCQVIGDIKAGTSKV